MKTIKERVEELARNKDQRGINWYREQMEYVQCFIGGVIDVAKGNSKYMVPIMKESADVQTAVLEELLTTINEIKWVK